ncbi:SET domain-containing protein SmydA-8-like isoform X4 [Nilaparvata lugens]|uniref:SET domain-containing protein SmydA-8-like isoform X2 n=1 Tax=Nilaparvata lugens TaxID=108931 RepID=UPI00193E8746|nr:SET domain-containing protein SmydA-8-like isoform X2 [Nilaparvata lugens]XP_039275636.1 SET domain-containing protein SmydA-8-like isoform X4 [Nilaparvata lugens]XP_039275638.1 SET domain-containing protein SmydA-8-like isoform X4 [Nilaparvata lugens]
MTEAFKIEKNDSVGRYAVTKRDYKPGQVLFEERPVAVGPKSCSPVLCLSCYTRTDGSVRCDKCGWPVCSQDCAGDRLHAQAECGVFSAASVRFQPEEDPQLPSPQLECITPLRVLLTKETDPERWKKEVLLMESHSKERKKSEHWNVEKVNIVDFLLKRCKLEGRFSDDEVHFVCGILEVNSFEVRTTYGVAIRGLYPNLAILSHNCVPNTTHSVNSNDNYRLTARATVDIKSGCELLTTYTHTIAPTLFRREQLLLSKYFECSCRRCADPTELGTHSSSLKCTKCDNGLIMSVSPLNAESEWKCTHCPFTLSADQVTRIFMTIQADIDGLETMPNADSTIETGEKLLRKYRSVLHPRHAFNTTIRHCLVQLYGRVAGYTFDDLPDILLEHKVDLCERIMEVADVIEPGYSRLRGLILYELHVPMMLFARARFEYGEINKETFCAKMEQVIKILEEATAILILEDATTSEGAIGLMGQQSLEQLKSSLAVVKSSAD